MNLKILFSLIFLIIVIFLLGFYWIVPFDQVDFGFKERNYNFSLNSSELGMQFYPNMRFPTSNISYAVEDCPLGKKGDMQTAFETLSNKTIMNFYDTQSYGEIAVSCDSKNRIEGGLFIAGEGGPTNITETSNFNVIKKGKILLIRESQCASPNVAIHELLHVLGFDHSSNPNNIMYNISKCNQEISQDMIDKINYLYSFPSYADLSIENVSSVMRGKYLDANITISNNGLIDSKNATLQIYADDKMIKEFEIKELEIGSGRKIFLSNIFIFKINVEKLKFSIIYNEPELNKEDNEIILDIQNKN